MLFLLWLSLVSSNMENYSEPMATTWMSYAGVAYCTDGMKHVEVESWTCFTCQTLPYMNATAMHSTLANGNGYVGYDPAANFILVAFSGTDPLSIVDWIDDIDTVQVKYPYCDGCYVHQGFYNVYLSLQSQVWSLVKGWLALHPNASVYTTGHSLGAALSAHAALDLKVNLKITTAAIYNYGQPRVGNSDFSAFFTQNIPTMWRVTHNKDPVPQLPEQDFGLKGGPFVQEVQEVWYNENSKQYKECDPVNGEDRTCSDGQLDYKVEDHLTYMNFDVTYNYMTCKF